MDDRPYKLTPCEKEDLDYIEEALKRHSDSFAAPQEGVQAERLVYKVLDPAGVVIAGIVATVDVWGVLAVDALWVGKRYRRKGIGSTLLAQMERLGREKGCYLSLVGTFDFQSPEFFDKMGYVLFNIWEDFPLDHANYSFAKRLDEEDKDKPLPYWIEVGEEEDGDYVEDRIAEYNDGRVVSRHGPRPLDKKITFEGVLIAGYSVTNSQYDTAHLDMLWVEDTHRRQGIGRALLQDAEREAKTSGAHLMLVGAYDWQVDFLVRCGYAVTGELQDCPKGHVYYSLIKRL